MQEHEYRDPLTSRTEVEEGVFCETTKRILIASALPASLRVLVGELTAQCYDVLVFHHMDADVLGKLPCDLLIVDLTPRMKEEANEEEQALALIRRVNAPSLVLSREPQRIAPQLPDYAEAILWPGSMELIMDHAAERTSRLTTAAHEAEQTAEEADEAEDQLRYKDIVVDRRRKTVHCSSRRLDVTKTEWELLMTFLQSDGKAYTRQELLDRVWGEDYYGGSNTVDVHIKTLRQKLGDDPRKPHYIATVRDFGYRLAD